MKEYFLKFNKEGKLGCPVCDHVLTFTVQEIREVDYQITKGGHALFSELETSDVGFTLKEIDQKHEDRIEDTGRVYCEKCGFELESLSKDMSEGYLKERYIVPKINNSYSGFFTELLKPETVTR
jgi:uncharacterized Zn finger protein (UPF0148 family)